MRRPPGRRTRRNSPEFIRAVIESTIENELSEYGRKRSAFATIHSHPGGSAARRHPRPAWKCRRHAHPKPVNRARTAEVESVAAAGIQDDIARRCGQHLRDRLEQRFGHAAIVQSPPGRRGSRCVAWRFGSPLLRLEQIDVSAARDVERMAAWTQQPPLLFSAHLARQGHVAVADGAAEHASSVVECGLGENRNMRKRIAGSEGTVRPGPGSHWMDLAEIATVEVTSEDSEYPIESVFSASGGSGWRASQKGEQQIRLIFDQALAVHRIQLHFLEPARDRLQEYHRSMVSGGRRASPRRSCDSSGISVPRLDQRARRL